MYKLISRMEHYVNVNVQITVRRKDPSFDRPSTLDGELLGEGSQVHDINVKETVSLLSKVLTWITYITRRGRAAVN